MIRLYEVTVSPKIVTYSGAATFGEYVVTVEAGNANEALKVVRRERRENEGRYAVPAVFRARVLKK